MRDKFERFERDPREENGGLGPSRLLPPYTPRRHTLGLVLVGAFGLFYGVALAWPYYIHRWQDRTLAGCATAAECEECLNECAHVGTGCSGPSLEPLSMPTLPPGSASSEKSPAPSCTAQPCSCPTSRERKTEMGMRLRPGEHYAGGSD